MSKASDIREWLREHHKRRRDIDNLGKAVYDALEEARVFDDDSQICDAHWLKGPIDRSNPRIEISLETM